MWFGAVPLPGASQLSQAPTERIHGQALPKSRELVLQAIRGSPDAASELIMVHDECLGHADADQERGNFCWQEVKKWVEIGLQNGSPLAAQMKVNELLQSRKCLDIFRAEYWLIRYRRAGAGNEMMWKSDAASIDRKKRSCTW